MEFNRKNRKRICFRDACIFVSEDPDWKIKIFIGGLLLMLPLIGWPLVLGYRKEAIGRIMRNDSPLLPNWNERLLSTLFEGLKCMGVIFTYLLPITTITWTLALTRGMPQGFPWLWCLLFFSIFPIFLPLAMPALIVYLGFFAGVLTCYETVLLLVAFHALVFIIPLGFMQVSLSGKYLSAFNLKGSFLLLRESPLNYLLAWIYSSIISLLGHFCIPFSAWGVVWAYLGIVYCFNEILYLAPSTRSQLRGSFYESFHA